MPAAGFLKFAWVSEKVPQNKGSVSGLGTGAPPRTLKGGIVPMGHHCCAVASCVCCAWLLWPSVVPESVGAVLSVSVRVSLRGPCGSWRQLPGVRQPGPALACWVLIPCPQHIALSSAWVWGSAGCCVFVVTTWYCRVCFLTLLYKTGLREICLTWRRAWQPTPVFLPRESP